MENIQSVSVPLTWFEELIVWTNMLTRWRCNRKNFSHQDGGFIGVTSLTTCNLYFSCPVESLMMYQGEPQSSRQRMRPWLEARVNSGEIPGLEWIDRNRRIFKVPWKSVNNRDWTELVLKFSRLVRSYCIVNNLVFTVNTKKGKIKEWYS